MSDLRNIPQEMIDYIKRIQTDFDVELECLEARMKEEIDCLKERIKVLEHGEEE